MKLAITVIILVYIVMALALTHVIISICTPSMSLQQNHLHQLGEF